MKNNPPSPRQTALNCLKSWHAGRSFAETLVDRECSRAALPPADRHLVQALVFSVLRNRTWLDHIIGTLRKGRLDEEARLILQLGLSQLFLLGMADHAAVYETVNLASVRLRGLVNAILRNALRREKAILEEREQLPLSIHYSTPAWLVRRWTEQMGPQTIRDLLRWNNTTPRLYVRANPLIPMKNIPASLAPLDRAPGWFSVEGLLPLEEIKAGSLYVADPSTRYSIDLLAPQPGEEILDACAAPGGKSAAIIAATISTADSQLLVASSSFTADLYKPFFRKGASEKETLLVGRVLVLVLSLIAFAIANSKGSGAQAIMDMVENAWGAFGASFGPTILLSLFWKRFNYKGAVAGVVSGFVVDLGWLLSGLTASTGVYEIVPGFIVSFLAAYLVARFTEAPNAEAVAIFEEATKPDAD